MLSRQDQESSRVESDAKNKNELQKPQSHQVSELGCRFGCNIKRIRDTATKLYTYNVVKMQRDRIAPRESLQIRHVAWKMWVLRYNEVDMFHWTPCMFTQITIRINYIGNYISNLYQQKNLQFCCVALLKWKVFTCFFSELQDFQRKLAAVKSILSGVYYRMTQEQRLSVVTSDEPHHSGPVTKSIPVT